jgi:hypothetical protein
MKSTTGSTLDYDFMLSTKTSTLRAPFRLVNAPVKLSRRLMKSTIDSQPNASSFGELAPTNPQ